LVDIGRQERHAPVPHQSGDIRLRRAHPRAFGRQQRERLHESQRHRDAAVESHGRQRSSKRQGIGFLEAAQNRMALTGGVARRLFPGPTNRPATQN
jgi:hypothetical protein